MKPVILLRVVWREYLMYALLLTLLGSISLYQLGFAGLVLAFWLKLIGGLGVLLYLYFFRRKHLFLFHNLGYGRRAVLVLFFTTDLITTLAIYLPVLLLRPYLSAG